MTTAQTLVLGILACACAAGPTEQDLPAGTASEPPRGAQPDTRTDATARARDLGIPFDGRPGQWNAITDVPGVRVGHTTIIADEGAHAIRTGVTAILANAAIDPVFASTYRLNGDGEMTGAHYVDEKGYLTSPIMLTGTASVGTVHEAVLRWSIDSEHLREPIYLPVVAETWDGDLNDLNGLHVTTDHVTRALEAAATGPVAEGNVGGGTGMRAHEFKAGIGTSSRVLPTEDGGYTVGVLVQANYGKRAELRIAGVPVGAEIKDRMPELRAEREGDGSIIVILATDAPLLPHQLQRVARRIPMGLARCGSFASTYSGDLFLAFSTEQYQEREGGAILRADYLPEERIDAIFLATVRATEEAIINALIAAETMTGVHGNRVHALPHDELVEVMARHDRLRVP